MPIEDKLLQLTWTLAAWEDYEYWQGQEERWGILCRRALRTVSGENIAVRP